MDQPRHSCLPIQAHTQHLWVMCLFMLHFLQSDCLEFATSTRYSEISLLAFKLCRKTDSWNFVLCCFPSSQKHFWNYDCGYAVFWKYLNHLFSWKAFGKKEEAQTVVLRVDDLKTQQYKHNMEWWNWRRKYIPSDKNSWNGDNWRSYATTRNSRWNISKATE